MKFAPPFWVEHCRSQEISDIRATPLWFHLVGLQLLRYQGSAPMGSPYGPAATKISGRCP